jgi:hypothetical protein
VPVILRVRGYRFWFYEADLSEPPHVHVAREDKEAKFWVEPVALARTGRFRQHELNEIGAILADHRDTILEAWREELRRRGHGQG